MIRIFVHLVLQIKDIKYQLLGCSLYNSFFTMLSVSHLIFLFCLFMFFFKLLFFCIYSCYL